MEVQTRLTPDMNGQDAVIAMSGGNPGALTVLIQLLQEGAGIDPDSEAGGLAPMLSLDKYGIHEDRIWMLYKDVCNCDLRAMVALLRAPQLGLLDNDKLHHAIDNRGSEIDVEAIVTSVGEGLPNFAKTEKTQ